MEWVETTGKTIEEAKGLALDELGVDESEAEFEILEEPKSGLFRRSDARVRARVRPTAPRAKDSGRRKRREKRGSAASSSNVGSAPRDAAEPAEKPETKAAGSAQRSRRKRGGKSAGAGEDRGGQMGNGNEVPLQEQAAVAADFLEGLADAFGKDVDVNIVEIDDETIEVTADGQDLGLLIGPGGQTLAAVQDLARTVVFRKTAAGNGRILVDIARYREKRKAALSRFTRQVAEEVLASGEEQLLEPMSAPDRKVVHDTINEIEGVVTASEGDEPRRRVVVRPG